MAILLSKIGVNRINLEEQFIMNNTSFNFVFSLSETPQVRYNYYNSLLHKNSFVKVKMPF